MSAISDATENAILNLIFSATTWANYAQNASATPETNIVVGLHTADPTDTGTMSSSESAYTNYARQNVVRSTGWIDVIGGQRQPGGQHRLPIERRGGHHGDALLDRQERRRHHGDPVVRRGQSYNSDWCVWRDSASDHRDSDHPGLAMHADEFARCLATCDVAGIRQLWAHVSPHLPQPTSDHDALIAHPSCQDADQSFSLRLRAYSHCWLIDNGYPSALPDELKPKAERMYPRIVDGVGIACGGTSEIGRAIAPIIQGAMSDAVMECYADGALSRCSSRRV